MTGMILPIGKGHVMTAYLISCENATCAIPEAYREIFRGSEDVVTSSEGWEPGSLNLAQGFAMKLRTPLVHADFTRLLMNFEQDGDERWSRFSIKLPEATRLKLIERYELPYRALLQQRIREDLQRHSSVLHVMVHTDAELDGRVVLSTPNGAVLAEKVATAWRSELRVKDLDAIHLSAAELTPMAAGIQRLFPADRYAQVALSVSQSFFLESRPWRWEVLKKLLLETLPKAVESANPVSAPESPATE